MERELNRYERHEQATRAFLEPLGCKLKYAWYDDDLNEKRWGVRSVIVVTLPNGRFVNVLLPERDIDDPAVQLDVIAALSSDGETQDLGETIGVGGGQMVCIGEVLEGWGIKVYGTQDAETFFVAKCDRETGERFADIVRGLAMKASALTAAEARIMELEEVQKKYRDLLCQVGKKYPDESRHDTARRYIIEAENSPSVASAAWNKLHEIIPVEGCECCECREAASVLPPPPVKGGDA